MISVRKSEGQHRGWVIEDDGNPVLVLNDRQLDELEEALRDLRLERLDSARKRREDD